MSNQRLQHIPDPTTETATDLLQEVHAHDLPPVLDDLVADYQSLEDARPPFMWKWVHKLAPENTLPCVSAEYTTAVPTDKTILVLFVTLLDDLLEKRRDRATFQAVSAIPFDHRPVNRDTPGLDTDYVAFAERVWDTFYDRLQRAPAYDAYADLLRYDLKQTVNAIEYSDLVIRRPALATMADLKRYESHNMAMHAYADVDLMHSPLGVRDDLAPLREAVWDAQQMARIGNWVSTWERELRESDYSNGIVIYALENGILDRSELEAGERSETQNIDQLIQRLHDHDVEDVFLRQWQGHYERLETNNAELGTVDLTPFIDGTREVLRYHLASRGLK